MSSQSQSRTPSQAPAQGATPAAVAPRAGGLGNADVAAQVPGARSAIQDIPGEIAQADVDTDLVRSTLEGHWHAVAFRTGANTAIQGRGQPSLGLVKECPAALMDEVLGMLSGGVAGKWRGGPTSWQPAGSLPAVGPTARVYVQVKGRDIVDEGQGTGTIGASSGIAASDSTARSVGASAGYAQSGASVGLNASRTGTDGLTVSNGSTQSLATTLHRLTGDLVVQLRIEVQGADLDVQDAEASVVAGRFGATSMWAPGQP